MRPTLPILAACLGLALTGTALVRAEDQSDKLLNEEAFAESEDSTQVREEKAMERKDQAGAPAAQGQDAGTDTPKAPAAGTAAEAGAAPAK